ncbi:hypothetical protein SeMB42_g06945 [Synchytrium endobioticum]|uniref:Uncharacterized protein n=1 Tax=Synchytrium endobioticum TaxID=286115 RepID=A0A507C8C6_9FUNG|nr:hypothetical protein SeMB42_g06945 [Synchytrium endobioticum]
MTWLPDLVCPDSRCPSRRQRSAHPHPHPHPAAHAPTLPRSLAHLRDLKSTKPFQHHNRSGLTRAHSSPKEKLPYR